MTIIVDAMGGDFAPEEIVKGALAAVGDVDADIVLVGDREKIEALSLDTSRVRIEHAATVIGMNEHPAMALRKKRDCSIGVAADLAKAHPGSALVSAGHTGAVVAAALMKLGRMEGCERPAVAACFPTPEGRAIILDVGGNVDCKPSHLVQFAAMGALYAEHVLGVERPRVGLLNIGEEEAKGNEQTKATFLALKGTELNFIGNVEPHAVFAGTADVVVADGFPGNIMLKASEAVSGVFHRIVAEGLPREAMKDERFAGFFKALRRFDTSNPDYSGAPLLGVQEACIICHGMAKAPTIRSAVCLAHRFAASDTLDYMKRRFQRPKG